MSARDPSAVRATGAALATPEGALGWWGIVRLGAVQAALGAMVVLVTSTLNRTLVVEFALPASVPGALVALHYAVQMARPRFGFGSDRGARRTPWILGGMGVLGAGAMLATLAVAALATSQRAGLALAVLGYTCVGLGAGAAGTSLLVLLARRVDDRRRAGAATIVWVMMIAGFAVTSAIAGRFLDPFSPLRLIKVVGLAVAIALTLALAAVAGVEGRAGGADSPDPRREAPGLRRNASGLRFSAVLRRVWAEPRARRFTLFVFVAMLAYSGQELLLEPFAGLVFGYSLGDSAELSGLWHGMALLGMIAVGIACTGRRGRALRSWTVGGCVASAVALLGLAAADLAGPGWPLRASVILLGLANGVFAVAAIGSMMRLAHEGDAATAGTRMGLWGAAQAIAFALGGLTATAIVDSSRALFGSSSAAFGVVFCTEAVLFLIAATFAASVDSSARNVGRSETRVVSL